MTSKIVIDFTILFDVVTFMQHLVEKLLFSIIQKALILKAFFKFND